MTIRLEQVVAFLAVFVAYIAAAAVGLAFHITSSDSITLLWVPSGFAVAVLLAWGRVFALPIALASFVINSLVGDASVLAAAAIAFGNTAEYLIVASLAAWALSVPAIAAHRIKRLAWMGLGVAVGCAVAATTGATALHIQGVLSDYWQGWSGWWAGDGLGILLFAAPCYFLMSRT